MPKIKKFYTAKNDSVFKMIFCDFNNNRIMKRLLESILGEKIDELIFLNNEISIEMIKERRKTVDVLIKVKGKYIHIELNSSYPSYLYVRNYIFFSKIFNTKTKIGEEYDLETKFIHIDFTYKKTKDNKDYRKYYIQDLEGVKYVENITIIEYNMDKIMGYWYNDDKEKISKYKYLIMIDLEKENLTKLSKGDEIIMEFSKKINKLNENETFQSAMTWEEDQRLCYNTDIHIARDEGYINGEKQGKKQGKEEIRRSMILSLSNQKVPLNVIAEASKLSEEEVLNIINNN